MQQVPAHDHEFMVESYDDWFAEWDEDSVMAYVYCQFRPLISSATDYERDETYDAYGDRCQAQLRIYWSFDEALLMYEVAEGEASAAQPDSEESGDGDEVPVGDETTQELLSKVNLYEETKHGDELPDGHTFVSMADVIDVGDETVLVVEHEGNEYELVWTVEDIEVTG